MDDYEYLESVLDDLANNLGPFVILSGGAKGVNTLAERYAEEKGMEIEIFKADWKRYGKGAVYLRNVEIWKAADLGIAFWDGQSKGTQHSFRHSGKVR